MEIISNKFKNSKEMENYLNAILFDLDLINKLQFLLFTSFYIHMNIKIKFAIASNNNFYILILFKK